MSNPSFSNIDRWFFELVEGNLTPEQEAQLKAFLLLHPELEIDLDAWEDSFVQKESVDFGDHRSLKKRRPVGLYMSLGFSFMLALLMVGLYAQFSELDGVYEKNKMALSSPEYFSNGQIPLSDQDLRIPKDLTTSENKIKTESVGKEVANSSILFDLKEISGQLTHNSLQFSESMRESLVFVKEVAHLSSTSNSTGW